VDLYAKAADKGYAPAQTVLGIRCLRGEGVPKDEAKGVALLRLAARQKDPLAACVLGQMFQDGRVLGKNETLAKLYLLRAKGKRVRPADVGK